MSILTAIVNIFLAPSEAFPILREKDSAQTRSIFLGILIFLGLINLAVLKDLYAEVQYEQTVERIENSSRIPEDQKEQLILDMEDRFENPSPAAIGIMWLTNAISYPIRVLFMAFIVMMIGNFIFGGREKFATILNMTALVYMVCILELLVKIPLMLNQWSIDIHTGLGILGLGEPGSFLYYFMNGMDFFAAWRIVLLGLGAGYLYQKKPGGFIVALFIYWILQNAFTAGLGALFV
ncbi:MAG: hypothetical protein ACE5D8_02840 [Fidelibacterota bacterium]